VGRAYATTPGCALRVLDEKKYREATEASAMRVQRIRWHESTSEWGRLARVLGRRGRRRVARRQRRVRTRSAQNPIRTTLSWRFLSSVIRQMIQIARERTKGGVVRMVGVRVQPNTTRCRHARASARGRRGSGGGGRPRFEACSLFAVHDAAAAAPTKAPSSSHPSFCRTSGPFELSSTHHSQNPPGIR
jgi:hypothetical protein